MWPSAALEEELFSLALLPVDNSVGATVSSFVTTSTSSAIHDIQWWGSYAKPGQPRADNFIIRFFADNGGNPAHDPFLELNVGSVGRGATKKVDEQGNAIFVYSVNINEIVLTPGTKNHILIENQGNSCWLCKSNGEVGAASRGFRFYAGDYGS